MGSASAFPSIATSSIPAGSQHRTALALARRQAQLVQLASLRAYYQSVHVWTTNAQAAFDVAPSQKGGLLGSSALAGTSTTRGDEDSTPKSPRPSALLTRRKTGMKLALEINPKRRSPSSSRPPSPSLRKSSPQPKKELSQALSLSSTNHQNEGTARIFQLFGEIVQARMEDLARTEQLLRDIHAQSW